MSGGHFDYKQHQIRDIRNSIEQVIFNNGRLKTEEELRDSYYRTEEEDLYHIEHPKEVIDRFKRAVYVLKKAEIYAQRIDWYLSGDDGDESFIRRLNEELKELDTEHTSSWSKILSNTISSICEQNLLPTPITVPSALKLVAEHEGIERAISICEGIIKELKVNPDPQNPFAVNAYNSTLKTILYPIRNENGV